jgi:DNA-binding transcriptional regulator/RsmH inhibitor MraZ
MRVCLVWVVVCMSVGVSFRALSYPAKLDVTNLSSGRVAVDSIHNERDIECSLRAFEDKVYMQLHPRGRSRVFNVPKTLKKHHLSLHCKLIGKVTKMKAWRRNRYATPPRGVIVFR